MGKEHPSAEQMAAYIDGALSATERGRMEAHLVRCQDCLAELLEVVQHLWRWGSRRPS
jgi:anti-sigma factor RsiW